jgi:cytochrome c-type biogenesis protein CcmH/NrfG
MAYKSAGKLDALETAVATPPPGADSGTLKQNSSQDAGPALSAPELDRTIQEVIQQRKYTWRMPREKIVKPDTEQKGIIGRFFERVGELLRRGLKAMWDGLESLLRRLFQGRKSTSYDASGYGWIFLLQLLPYLLIAAVAAGLGFLLYRLWLSRRRPAAPIAGEPIQPAPDLLDESVGAEQLPEDGWSKLARELLAQGELRLATRAFYLASLAH